MSISYWRFATFHSDSWHPRKSILHPKVGRSLLKMHDISWNWMLFRQVRLLLPDCLVHLHPDGRSKQGRGPRASILGRGQWFLCLKWFSRGPGVNVQVTWLVSFLFGRFATITQPHREWLVWVIPFRLSSCCLRPLQNTVSLEHKLLLVCFVLMNVFLWLSDCEQQKTSSFEASLKKKCKSTVACVLCRTSTS